MLFGEFLDRRTRLEGIICI